MLLEVGELEFGALGGHHDLGQAVGVLDDGPGDVGVAVGVGANAAELVSAVKGVREVDDQRLDGLDHAEQGMELYEHEGAAGTKCSRDAAHPGVQVADPTKNSNGRVDEVEGVVELVGEVPGVGLDGGHPDDAAECQFVEAPQSRGGEVDAGHAGAVAGESDRVEAQVALQVHDVEVRDAGPVGGDAQRVRLLGAQLPGARDEGVDVVVVVGAAPVEIGQLLPVIEVRMVHGARLSTKVTGGD